jgi:hypothetical protein
VDGAIQYVYLHNVLAVGDSPPPPANPTFLSRLRGPPGA